jgi:hypothetical protein
MRQSDDLLGNFRIPMTTAAYNEFILVQELLDGFPGPQQEDVDSWSFI